MTCWENMGIKQWQSLPGNKPKPKRKAPENAVKNACMEWLLAHKIIRNRQQSGIIKAINPHTRKEYWIYLAEEGSGDIVGCTRKGRYYEIETKPPKGGRWEKSQQARKKTVEASGGIYILARSVDDIVSLLTA